MNKPVRPGDIAAKPVQKTVDQLLRGFRPELSYRALEPRMAFDGAAAPTAGAIVDAQLQGGGCAAAAEALADAAVAERPAGGAVAAIDRAAANTPVRNDHDELTAANPWHSAAAVDEDASNLLAAALTGEAAAHASDAPEVYFIDQDVDNIDQIVSAIDADAEIVLINGGSSGLEQMAKYLAGRSDIGSIHIISHGEAGALFLGSDRLTAETLSAGSEALATIGRSLSDSGDILLYGCEIGKGTGGMDLVRGFAAATGADVAASVDNTGGDEAGGDWVLEATAGAIEAKALSNPLYAGLLVKTNTGAAGNTWAANGATAANDWTNTTDGVTTTVTFVNSASASWTSMANDTLNNIAAFDNSAQGTRSLSVLWDTPSDTEVGQVTIQFSTAVTNPVVHLDRLGGVGGDSNSSMWTLATPGATLTKIAGPNHFIVNSVTGQIYRQLDVTTSGTESSLTNSAGTAAGSVRINGTFTSITFNVRMENGATGGSGIGDGLELALAIDAPPVAVNDTFTTVHDTPVTINVRANDSDIRGDAINVTRVNGTAIVAGGPGVAATGGTVTLVSGNLVFTPNANYTGSPSFTYTIADANGGTSTATVNGTVTNVAPTVDLNGDPAVAVSVSGGGTFSQPSVDAGVDRTNTLTFSLTGDTLPDTTRAVAVLSTVDDTIRILVNGTSISSGDIAVDSGGVGPQIRFSDNSTIVSGWVANTNGLPRLEVRVTESGVEFWGTRTSTSTVLEQLTYQGTLTLPDFVAGTNTVDIVNVNGPGPESISGVLTVTSQSANYMTTYAENGAPVAISEADSIVRDVDDSNMESASITLTNPQTGDRLLVNGSAGTTGTIGGITWTRTNTTVTFSGSATKAQYADAIEQIQFENTTDTPATTPRTINVIVNDGSSNSNTAVATINIDRAPDPVNDAFSGNEDSTISANVATNDTDLGDGGGAFAVVTGPANGTLTSFNTATGAFVYTPTGNFNGTDTFTYRYTDADGDTKTATVTLTVNPVNDAPVNTVPGAQTTNEDTPLVISGVSVNDIDGAGVSLTTTLSLPAGAGILNIASSAGVTVSGDGSGTVTITGTAAAINAAIATITYTPTADYNGSTTLTVSTSDGLAPAVVSTVGITVTPVVDIANNSVTTNEDTPVTFAPLANDSFENSGRYISAINGTAIVAGGAGVAVTGGMVTLDASGNLTFTPNPNYNGTPSFTYTVTSGGVTETATVNMTVTAVNDAPTQVLPAAQSTTEDTAKVVTGVSVAEVDGGPLTTTLSLPAGTGTISVVTGGGATITNNGTGTVTISGTAAQINAALASITYTPTADYNGSAPLTVSTTDGTATASGTVAISVTPVADITNDAVSTNEDTARTFNVLTGTNGATADTFEGTPSVTGVTQPANGSVVFAANGSITYTPSANFNGTDTFTYTVTSGGVTETATVTVTVNAVNDAPVNTVPGAQSSTEDTSVVFSSANGNAIAVADVDSNVTTTLTIANGTLTLGSIAGVTVTGNGTGTVTVSGTAAAVTAALNGLAFAPTADWNGSTTLNVSTSDGVAPAAASTVAVTVTPVVDIASNAQTTAEDTATTFNVLANDSFENAGALVSSVTQPAHGTVTIGAGGNVTYTPAANYNGPDSFTYTVTSGGVTETTTVTLNVTAVNDAPVDGNETNSVSEDATLTVPAAAGLLANASDIDGGALSISAFTIAGQSGPFVVGTAYSISGVGSVTVNADGSYSFTPVANYAGPVPVLTYTVSDGNGGTDTSTLTLSITPINDAPVDGNETNSVAEDGSLFVAAAGGLLANTTDIDGGAATVTAFSIAGQTGPFTLGAPYTIAGVGSLTINSDGSYSFTPVANYNGSVPAVTYTVSDGAGGTDTSTLTLAVTPVNDAPVADDESVTATEDTTLSVPAGSGLLVGDTDVDGNSLTVTQFDIPGAGTFTAGQTASIPGVGTLQINSDGSYVFTPALNYNGPVPVTTYTVSDGNGGTDTGTLTITMSAVNDPPVANDDSGTATEDAPLIVDAASGLLSNDTDPEGATPSVTSFSVSGDPAVYTAGQTATIAGVGTLKINGDGSYTFTPAANYNGPVPAVTYTITDGSGGTDSAILNLAVSPANDAPVNTVPGAQTVPEDVATAINGVSVADIDGNTLTTTLTVTNGTLSVATGGTAAISNNGTGTVTITGTAAEINAALAGLSFTGNADYNGPALLTVATNDGTVTDTDTVAITVTPVADIAADTVAGTEDASISFNVLSGTNGASADNFEGSPSVTGFTQPANGSVMIDASGNVVYTPNANFNGTDTFTYTVTSGGVTETTTVTVNVAPANDVPTQALPPAQTGTEDTDVVFNGANGNQIILGDIDSGASVTTTVSVPAGSLAAVATPGVTITGNGSGTVTLSGTPAAVTAALNGLTYTPAADANGTVTMSVTTTDGVATPVSGTVDIALAPVADINNDSTSTNEDVAKVITVLGNDTFENPGRTVSSVTNGANGIVTINGDGTVTYTPNANFNGTDSFTYTVTSGGVTETATVTVVVNPVNDAPVQTVPGAQSTSEDSGLTFGAATGNAITVADLDGNTLTTTVSVTNGTIDLGAVSGVTVSGDGTGTVTISGSAAAINAALDGLIFNPTADYNGGAVMTVSTSDGTATVNNTIALSVTAVVDIVADTIATNEDQAVTVNVLTNDTFENSGAAVTSVTQGAHGTVMIGSGGQITYTPAANYNGPDSFTYTVTSGGVTETVTVTVNVAAVNDTPVTTVPPGQTTNEDANLVFSAGNGNAIAVSDIDGDTITVTLSGTNGLLTLGSTGSVSVSGNGTSTVTLSGSAAAVTAALNGLTFAPAADYNGPAVISVTTSDGTVTNSDSIAITVNPVADVVADSVSTNEDTPVTFNVLTNDTFEDPGRAVSSVTQGASGTVSFLADGTLIYTPDTDFFGTDTFTYTVTSGGVTETTTVTVTVGSVNDLPTTTGIADKINQDGQTVSVNVAASFADDDAADTLTYSATGLPPGLSINPATGVITGTIDPNASQGGPYTVTVTASDGHPGGTVSTSFTWSVSNPAPTANDDTAAVTEDTPATITVLGNDTDPDGDPLTVTAATAGNGTVSINPDGTINYTPDADFVGTDTIVYQISDGNGGTSTATVTITVTPVNDDPTTTGLGDLVDNDSSTVSIDVSSAFNDVDGDTLTYAVSGLPAGLTFNPTTGVISGTIDPNASQPSGDESYLITVTADDGNGGTVTTAFTWRVLNIPPSALDDSVTTPEDTPVIASILTNDNDPDNDPLTITEINGQPITLGGPAVPTANGSVQLLTDAFGQQVLLFTPNPDFNGVETLVYKVNDPNSGFDTATLTINVLPQNDAPTADALADLSSLDSDAVNVPLGPFFHDIDTPDGDALTFSALGLPPGLSIDPSTGTISGTIDASASQSGPYTVVVTATDSEGAVVSQTFTWNVTNPAPAAVNDVNSVTEGTPVSVPANGILSNDTDPDSDPLTVDAINGSTAAVGQPVAGSSGGLFTINADGSYTFSDNGDFEDLQGGETRQTLVTYRLSDGNGGFATATLTITVSGSNDAPVATPVADITTVDSAPLTLNAASAFTDIDGDTLTYAVTGLPAGLTLNPSTGMITGTIDHSASQAGAGGVYTVTVTADDGNGGVTPTTFTITVTNPAPTAGDDTATTDEDTPVSGTVAGNDSDPDGDPLTYTKASDPANGTVVVNPDGTYTYTPDGNFNGTDSFTYTVTDSDGASKTQTVTVTVNPVNDAPTNNGPIAPQTVNDGDVINANISGLFQDVDGDTLTYSVTGLPAGLSLDPVTGQVTGTIDNSASQAGGGVYTVVYTATDPDGESTSVTITVTVLNPAPVSSALSDTTGVDNTAVNIPTGPAFSDPDGDALQYSATGLPAGLSINPATGVISGTLTAAASAGGPLSDGVYSITVTAIDNEGGTTSQTFTYTVSNPAPTAGNDSFTGNEDTPISGSVTANDQDPDGDAVSYAVVTGPAHGTLTFNPDGTFTYTPDANYNGPDSFTYKIIDAQGKEATATVTLGITPVNDVPGPAAAAITTPEDTPISGTLPSSDVDGDTVSFTLSTAPSHGTVVVNSDGTYTYTPAPNYYGPDSFVVELDDGNGGKTLQTVSVTVTPVNDAPVAVNNSYSTNEDTTLTIAASGILGNDTDVDGDPLSSILVSGPSHGTLTLNADGSFTYTPDPNYNGPDSFTYRANDGSANSNVATVSINVTPVNDAPVATDNSYAVTEDTPVSGNAITDNTGSGVDSDIENSPLTVTQFVVGGTTYTAGTTANLAEGTLVINTDGSFTFTPALNYNGPVPAVTYTLSDGALTDTATLNLGPVAAVNDAPVAVDDTRTMHEDTPASGNLISNDTDVENDTLTVTDFTVDGTTYSPGTTVNLAEGDLTVNGDGTWSFNPAPNYNGPVPVIDYTIDDGHGGIDTGTLTLNVSAANDPPVAADDNVPVTEDTPVSGNVLGNDTDMESDPLTVTDYTVAGLPGPIAAGTPVTIPGVGTLQIDAGGAFTFTPAPNYNGPVPAVTYTVSDGAATDTGTLNLGPVTTVNDAPVAGNDTASGNEDTPITGKVLVNDSDVDGDALTVVDADGNPANGITPVSGPAHGTLTLNADGTFSYTPDADFHGTDSFTYRISDGHGGFAEATVTLSVAPVNDAPLASNDQLTTPEDKPFSGKLPVATDVDGDALTYGKGTTAPAHGTVTINPDGTYTYVPNPNYNGPDTFTYTVTDGTVTVEKTVTVMVTPVNDAPVIKPIAPQVSSDSSKVTFDVSKFTSDVELDKLTFKATGLPPGLSIDPKTGLITGTLTKDASQGGPYTVTLTVDDGKGGVVTTTFVWNVENPDPVAKNDTAEVKTGKSVSVDVLGNDSDPDGDTLTVTKAKAGNGTAEILADGSIKYTPKPGFVGTDTITYVISDGNGGYAIASVTINVADDGYNEKPPVFGFNGPEHRSSGELTSRTSGYQPITAEGAVVDAVFGIDELGSLAGRLSADGAVLAAANGARSLGGLATLGPRNAVIEVLSTERAREIERRAGWERMGAIGDIRGLPGFSLRRDVPGNLGGLSDREQVIIESIVRGRTLIVQISNTIADGKAEIVDYRISQVNGAELPEWLDRIGKDLLIGERAANAEVLKLRVEAVYSDGTVVIEEVKIDPATGEIQQLGLSKQGALTPKLFGEQFRIQTMLTPDQIQTLGRAIAR